MIHEFNLALLGKQLWGLMQFPDSLLARVLRGKYFRCSLPLRLNKTNNSSYGWTSIMAENPLVTLGIRQKVHSRHDIRIWEVLWIPTIPARPAMSIAPVVHSVMPISKLLIGSPKRWNSELLENYVNLEDIPLIQSLAINQGHQQDEYC